MSPRGLMRGFGVVDLVTVVVLLGIFAATVVVVRSPPAYVDYGQQFECMNNVRNLVQTLEVSGSDYPQRGGANLVLALVERRDLAGEDQLRLLFCPGDVWESLEAAGGVDAYRALDLGRHGYDHLTSYAGRDVEDPRWRVARRTRVQTGEVALVADDSEDHHGGLGFIVGYTGGAVRWRAKRDDWGLDRGEPVEVGPGSPVPELECLRAD